MNLATGVAYVCRAAGAGTDGGRGWTTCTDRLRARLKGEGAARRMAYGGWPSYNRAYRDCGLLF